ncbi:hypothetical protein TNCV_1687451 [Trichonephila clavipes]|nr:hypothetical protein TNCV_1687451 [Trichonephila clavipes]
MSLFALSQTRSGVISAAFCLLKVATLGAFGDGPRNFEPWLSDKDDTWLAPSSPNYHTNGRTFELSADLTCIAPLHGGSSMVPGSNSRQTGHESVTLTTRLPRPPQFFEENVGITFYD